MQPHNSLFQASKAALYTRSTLYNFGLAISTLIFAPIMLASFMFPFHVCYSIANGWVRLNLWSLKKICGLSHQVKGSENIPNQAAVILCKHQSAWETLAMQTIFPPQVFIIKRELLWLPFFGWALATCEPIAINRKARNNALSQLITQGTQRLKSGRWVIIFPEGTRVPPGKKGQYGGGGAILAQRAGYPIIPVAHNSGEFWGRYSFLKYPGEIQVRIGPVVDTKNRKARDINKEAENSLKKICGLSHQVKGSENIPNQAAVILCKHQSAWETLAMQTIFPPQVFIIKRELLWLPFFGWALATCEPIAINRKARNNALSQLITQGTQRLKSGRWVIIFPEGTRVPPGKKGQYGGGGAILAQRAGYPIIPVAHNSGEFWGRYSFLKYPGEIQVRIGPAIDTKNRKARDINKEAENWIEQQMSEITAATPAFTE